MTWLAGLPPRPGRKRLALWVLFIVGLRAVLSILYLVLGDIQAGRTDTLGYRVVCEVTGFASSLPLLFLVAAMALRWPLSGPRPWRALATQALCVLPISVLHTTLMEVTRVAAYPLIGDVREFTLRSWLLSVAHELPNDLFYVSIAVALLELWRLWWRASERERAEVELRRSLAEAQLQSLRLQLQPHFLFNALNTVSSTMYDEPARADAMLGRVAELLRVSLRTQRGDTVPLVEELEIAQAYASLQQDRFGERLTVLWEIADEVRSARVPVFLLQPLLENAVRHGGVERRGHGRITVTAHPDRDGLRLRVWDDGPGGSDIAGGGLGLRATAERIRLLFGDAAEWVAGPVRDGWLVSIWLPSTGPR
jgi:two-component system, LytTR family, sensor kinase